MFRTLGCLVVIYDICDNIHRICANIGSYLACNVCAAWPTVGSWRGNLLGKIGLEGAAYQHRFCQREHNKGKIFIQFDIRP